MADKKKKAPKSVKDKLAKGAADIRKAEADAKKKTPAVIEPLLQLVESKREIRDILADHVQMLPDNIGMKISDNIPIEESLRVLDYATALGDHVGFMIGDVIVHGQDKFGAKYDRAMQQTGRQRSTLKGYVEAARKFPPDQRAASLSFSHHRELVRLTDDKKRGDLLKETAALADKGKLPSTKELRYKVQKQQPPKPKAPKKAATSGKGKKGKPAPKVEAYKPTDDEQAMIDQAEDAIAEIKEQVTSAKLRNVLLKVDNTVKKAWSKMLQPFETLKFEIDKATGY